MLTDRPLASEPSHRLLTRAEGALDRDPDLAARGARAVLSELPEHPRALHLLGEALARIGDVPRGADLMRRAVAADGSLADLQDSTESGAPAWIGRFEPAACPLCGGAEGEPVWAGNLSRVVPSHRQLDPIRVWLRCGDCGLTRVERPVPREHLRAWREATAEARSTPPDPAAFSSLLLAQDELIQRIREEGYGTAWVRRGDGDLPQPHLLEIGSSWGAGLAAARWRGFGVVGLEADPRRASWSRRRLGVEVHHGSLQDGLPEGPFDVVVLHAPLCTFEDPVGAVRVAAGQLEEGGLLALVLPTLDHPVHQLRGARDPLWTRPERRAWYDRQSVAQVLMAAAVQAVGSWHDPLTPGSAIVLARPEADLAP